MYVIKSGVLYDAQSGSLKEFQSPFAEDFFAEESRTWGHESWKYKQNEGGAADQDLVPRSMLWGGRSRVKAPAKVQFKAVFETPGRLYYVLEMSTSCGLFYYDFARSEERRIFHKTEFQPRGLFINDDYSILTTVNNTDGAAHLVQYDADGKREQVLTSGDCRDENPYRRGNAIYYQSSGLARNAQGVVAAVGNTTINKFDTATGDIDVVLETDKFDYLLPRVTADGTLYCIRTPHQTNPAYPLKNVLIDIVLFPWRLCVAIFAFLNVFSIFFAKKPLTMAGGPNPREMDVSQRMMHNRIVNLQETWRKEGRKVAVSKEWKLVRRQGGADTEIASNVLWFDLDKDDNPVYTDGYSLYDSQGSRKFEVDELVSCLTLAR
jgi:hypothetical protein